MTSDVAERPIEAPTLGERDTAEAKRLRAKGWAISGLARRYRLTRPQMAHVLGETWGKA